MEHTGFPSDETLAAFIDGRLDEETRKRVVEHLAECGECRETYLGVTQCTRGENAILLPARARTRAWYIAVLAAAAAVAVFVLLPSLPRISRKPDGNATLSIIDAANHLQYRTIDSRLDGSYAYRALRPVHRGNDDSAHEPEMVELRLATTAAEQRANAHPSRDALLAYGTGALLTGDYSEAQKVLEQALFDDTGKHDVTTALHVCRNVSLLNAMAALYTARAPLHAQERLLAIEAADRAWTLQRTPETAWNRAVALEGIASGTESEQAWLDYLKVDPNSPWSTEAMRRLRKHRGSELRRFPHDEYTRAAIREDDKTVYQIIAAFRQESRTIAEDEFLSHWAQHLDSGPADASNDERALRLIGHTLEKVNGEKLVGSLADRLTAADAGAKSAIAATIKKYTAASKMHIAQDSSNAAEAFRATTDDFRNEHFPLWLRSEVFRATALAYAGRFEEGLQTLNDLNAFLIKEHEIEDYPSVVSQLFWMRGFIQLSQGKPVEALRDYERSVALLDRLGELENAAFLRTLIGQLDDFLGQPDDAWREYVAAAEVAGSNRTMRRRPLIFGQLAKSALSNDYTAASAVFQRAATNSGLDDPSFRVDALLASARSAAADGDLAGADAAIHSAMTSVQSIADGKVRKRIENDIQASAAEIGVLDRQRGGSILTEAIADSERDHDVFRLSRFYFLRAALHGGVAQEKTVIDDYESGIAELQKSRADLRRTADVRDWLRTTRNWFDGAIAFAMKNGRPEKAVAWVDDARSEDMGVSVAGTGQAKASPRAALRSGDAVLMYWSTPTELYLWAISERGVESRTVPVTRQALRGMTRRICELLKAGRDNEARSALANADDVLLAPVRGVLSRANRVVIVPDDCIAGIPFGALFNRMTARYALEDFQILLASSSRAGVRALEEQQTLVIERAVVVADPAFDSNLLPLLRRLPQAATEAEVVQRHFRRTETIAGDTATARRFLEVMADASLVHFAGHSVANAEQPGSSVLVLAPDPATSHSGLLYAADIEKCDFHKVRLAVLASCSSVSGVAKGDGFANIARAFASAGVPNIIGTLWDIPDGSASEFLGALYSALVLDGDVGRSFREAQLEMIRRSPQMSWAAFELMIVPEKEK